MIAVVRDGMVIGVVSGVTPGPSPTGWVGTDGRPFVLPAGHGGELAEVPAGTGIGHVRSGDAWVPPHLADLGTAQAWATSEVDRIFASIGTVTLQDGITYSVDEESERKWNSLLRMSEIAAENGAPFWPQEFVAADGAVVVLDDEAEAKMLFFMLSMAVNARRVAAIQARHAIEDATTVESVVTALQNYIGA